MIKTKIIRQSVNVKASPEEVYDVLMDSKKHSKLTGGVAKISPKVGGKFTAYDLYIDGENLELIPGKKIVQSWRASDWDKNYYSTVIFEFKKIKSGTKLSFTHKNIPPDQFKSISDGWKEFYWEPLKEMFAK